MNRINIEDAQQAQRKATTMLAASAGATRTYKQYYAVPLYFF
jgi:hypothetical protein